MQRSLKESQFLPDNDCHSLVFFLKKHNFTGQEVSCDNVINQEEKTEIIRNQR